MADPKEVPRPDFADFKPKGQQTKFDKQKASLFTLSTQWWKATPTYMPGAIMAQVGAIIKADRGRIDSYNTFAKLYGTFTPTFWNGYQLANSGRPTAPMRDRLSYNIVQSCIDTVTSMLIQNKPKPMFLTMAGDSKQQRRAKKLDAFCYGVFYENDVYKLAPKIFRDACVFGEGIVHCYSEFGRIKYERVLPYEILVDYLESHYGPESTMSMHRIKNIDRTQLAEDNPEKRDDIMKMISTSSFISTASRSISDTVTVVESWRLPVGIRGEKNYVPGLHAQTTENTIIDQEEYHERFFPFAIMRFSPRLYGFYSQGMAEQLVPIQVEINRTLISIQRSLYLGGTHKIFVKAGSKIIKSHFDNLIGTIMEYAGDTPPQYVVPQLVQPEIYAHLQNMVSMGYQLPGVSQMNATSVKTPGVDSGKAMRTEQNIHSQRFASVGQMYENFFIDLSKITVATARKAYEEDDELSVKVPGSRFIQQIKWSEVNLEDDQFVLQIYPVSKLPQDPEGRLSTIQEMMQAGLIDPQTGRRLLDYPDLESEENLGNATSDYLHSILDKMVEEGEFVSPDPFDDLTKAKQLALEYYANGKLNNLEEEKLELLRRFISQINVLTAPPPQMPGPQGPQIPGSAPQAAPMAPPQSDLIPNIQGGQPQ